MNLAGHILKIMGWRFVVNTPPVPKSVICIAPHTSNWDFFVGELAVRSAGFKAGFLMKDTWFFFPLGYILRAIGGIPVSQHHRTDVTASVVKTFNSHKSLAIGITPEGTRSPNPHWHRGFLYIAQAAQVPIILAYIDYATRTVCIDRFFEPSGDMDRDMIEIKNYFKDFTGRHPEKFCTGL